MEKKYATPDKSSLNASNVKNIDKQKEKLDQFKSKLFKQERDRLWQIIKEIRRSQNIDNLLFKTTDAIQKQLECDRVCIYRFDPESEGQSGQTIAESLRYGYTPTLNEIIPSITFGSTDAARYNYQGFISIFNLEAERLSAYQKQLLDKFQIQASLALPILVNRSYSLEESSYEKEDRVWGLLVVQQCAPQNSSLEDPPRQWQEDEINLLDRISVELSLRLQQDRFALKLSEQQDILTSIDREMSLEMQETAGKVRSLLAADRVLIYAFNPDWSSQIVAESVGSSWQITKQRFKGNYFFKPEELKTYRAVSDIHAQNLDRSWLEALEQLKAKAYIAVPIEQNGQLLGVLTVYQNSGSRNWQESEIDLAIAFVRQFIFPLQQTLFLRKTEFQSERIEQNFQIEKELKGAISFLRKAEDEASALQIATREGRKILKVDRVAIYRFKPDWSGEFIAESYGAGWSSLIKNIPTVKDTYLQENQGGRYKFGECFAVDDIYNVGHQPCHIELLEQFEARAYAIAPIMTEDNRLWGLLGAYDNQGVRKWQAKELEALKEIGIQLRVARERINYLNKLEVRANREATLNKIVARIRQSLNLNDIFATTTREIRILLQCDRVAIYRFNPDWSGEFIAESHDSEWVSLLEKQRDRPEIKQNVNVCSLRNLATERGIVGADTQIQATKGSIFTKSIPYRVSNNIYDSNFSDCYIRALEAYQAKAYITFALYQGEQLWGLLAAYQNSAPRNWQESEVKLLNAIASQLAVAVLQAEYVDRLEEKSENLARALERETAAKDILERRAVEMLTSIKPAFQGNLTVRANVTQDQIGTIAAAYNTTLDSLQDIVLQVKNTVVQVVEIANNNKSSIEELSTTAELQMNELRLALGKIQDTIEATEAANLKAQQVESAIARANQTVASGDKAMNKSVESILEIRKTVTRAGKRVKYLRESSQKISKVTNLISSFANQTNILALNASLEATRAGEHGKGFAVVADRVRSISLQSAEATTEIEKLIDTIQEETLEVSSAMETGVEQVSQGTNLVNETRENLNDIVSSTAEISELIRSISSEANNQMQQAESVMNAIAQIGAISNEASSNSLSISASFQELLQIVSQLEANIAQFKVQ